MYSVASVIKVKVLYYNRRRLFINYSILTTNQRSIRGVYTVVRDPRSIASQPSQLVEGKKKNVHA